MQSVVFWRWTFGLAASLLLASTIFSALGCGAYRADSSGTQILYVGNQEPNTVSAYTIGSDGSLTAVPASPFGVGGNTLIADPTGKVLFSSGLNNGTIQLNTDRVARDGSLTMSSSISDNTLAGVRAINPAGTALYVSSVNAAEGNWGWKIYSIQPDGTLQSTSGIIDQASGRLVFTPDGTAAFAAYCYFLIPNIEQFAVGRDGSLTNTRNRINTPIAFGECPNAVAMTPAGDMVAAPWSDANQLGSGENFITLFNVDPKTHDLDPLTGSKFAASGAGRDAIFDPSGEFLFTAQDNGIGVYRVGQHSLTEVSGSPFGGEGMDRVIFSPFGGFVVALSRAAGKIFVLAFDSSTGTLTLAPGSPISTSSPNDLAVIQR